MFLDPFLISCIPDENPLYGSTPRPLSDHLESCSEALSQTTWAFCPAGDTSLSSCPCLPPGQPVPLVIVPHSYPYTVTVEATVLWCPGRPSVFREASITQDICGCKIRNSVTQQMKRRNAPKERWVTAQNSKALLGFLPHPPPGDMYTRASQCFHLPLSLTEPCYHELQIWNPGLAKKWLQPLNSLLLS